MKLRPYQSRAISETYASMRQHQSTMLQLPTGSGKSFIAQKIIEHGLRHDKRINFLTDRIVLSDQIFERLHSAGIPTSVMQSDHCMYNPAKPVQVCSVQTLARRSRENWPPADLIIVDEAHCQYDVISKMMRIWDGIKWLGLSATPFTRGLGTSWNNLVVGSTTGELMSEGYLCDYEAYGPSTPDLTNVRRSGNDFALNDLEERMNSITGSIVKHWLSHATGKKTIAFTPTVAYAKSLANEFERDGVGADYVCGHDTDERRSEVLEKFRNGTIKVLANCDVLTRGYDQPDIEVGIIGRPTRSLSLHIQMLGRLLRTSHGKDKALILDHAGNIERLGFPDDPLPRMLCQGERGKNSDTRPREEPQPWNCPKCFTLVPPKIRACTTCGHIPVRKSEVEVKPGVLQKLERSGHGQKQTVYSMLNCIATDQGYKPGWVANKYKAIFGVWPRKMKNTILTPTPELREWLKGERRRFLAYHHIRENYHRRNA